MLVYTVHLSTTLSHREMGAYLPRRREGAQDRAGRLSAVRRRPASHSSCLHTPICLADCIWHDQLVHLPERFGELP